ncbi:MAG TPA: type III secretion system chaperone, partial [Saprospiraceae bacterium]|nr:type III secretion system chaperone [Saprospiraceae bacterium]
MKAEDLLIEHTVFLITQDNTGIGTLIKDTDLLVCCEKTVRNCSKIRYEDEKGMKGYAEVIYLDEVSNFALCKHPLGVEGYELCTTSSDNYGENASYKIQGEPIIINNKLLGIKSYPIIQYHNTTFTHASSIEDAIRFYEASGKAALVKCSQCNEHNDLRQDVQYCATCGNPLNIRYKLNDRPSIYLRIEEIIKKIGLNPTLSRRGDGIWHLRGEDVVIELSYHQRFGAIIAEINLGTPQETHKDNILLYLLNQNYHNKELTLSLKQDCIFLCLTLYDNYLDDYSSQKA